MTFTIPIWLMWLLGIVVALQLVLFVVFLLWIGFEVFFNAQPGRGDGSWWR